MFDKVIERLFQDLPAVAVTVGIVVLVIYLLREFRKNRDEIKQDIETAIDARIGSLLGRAQEHATRIAESSAQLHADAARFEQEREAFHASLQKAFDETQALTTEAERKLRDLIQKVPNVEELSAQDILAAAQGSDSSSSQAALCTRLLEHSDATSKNLEIAGDLMRKDGRLALAQRLYEKAAQLDPENIGAQIEMLCLRATTDASTRDRALAEAGKIALESKNRNAFTSVANVYIHLDRYSELAQFSNEMIARLDGKNPQLSALAQRNLAVAYKEEGELDRAREEFEKALAVAPEDENILKAYTGVLRELHADDEYRIHAERLISMDPADIDYYIMYIRWLTAHQDFDGAELWLSAAEALPPNPYQALHLEQTRKKIEAFRRLPSQQNGTKPNNKAP